MALKEVDANLYAAIRCADQASRQMTADDVEILFEDNHLLAVNKPPGLATIGASPGTPSLARLAKQYIKRRYRKPGNVYLGVMSRLDAGTSGVVLFARTSKAAARLTEQFRTRRVSKIYWTIVSGRLPSPEGELVDWLVKDEARQRMAICALARPGAKEARLRYKLVRELPGGSLLEIELLTGRKHQIRLQLAARGLAIWGETKYAAGRPFASGLALHARKLVVEHPVRKTRLELIAPPPASWKAFGIG
jgi:23S rRNA pseudouridine1911/1915/1917 synthase